jgi:serine/threonine-protein kinase RsbT
MAVISCSIAREVDVYVAIGRGRELAMSLGFDEIDRTRIEIVILELARNILAHAHEGKLCLEALETSGRNGMAVEAQDRGPGIADVELAMRDGYSTAQTLGAGLPGVRRLMDDFAIESTLGTGTRVRAVKWLGKPRPSVAAGGRRS